MKTTVIFALLSLSLLVNSKELLAQGETMYPIGEYYVPDVELSNTSGTIQGPSNVYLGGSHGSNYFKANGSSNITVKGEKVVIRRSHIGGNTQPGFRFNAKPGGPSIASNYSYANGMPQVPLFEKIEFGIRLPVEIQSRIDKFLNENATAVGHTTDYLNPYDPQDISVEATLTFNKPVGEVGSIQVSPKVFGFYYQEFSVDPGSNNYNSINTEYPFRIRIAPIELGNHTVSIIVKYKKTDGTMGEANLTSSYLSTDPNNGNVNINNGFLSVQFNAIPNDNSKSYHKGHLEIGHHKRHLRHSYSKTSFFPIGTNNVEWAKNENVHPEYKIGPNFWHGPVGYASRRNDVFVSLANHQGNFSRIISMGRANAIESTTEGIYVPEVRDHIDPNVILVPAYYSPDANQHHLGNYHLNQTHLWETDKDIRQCEDLGIFLLFCLQIHYPFMEQDPYGGGVNGLEKWANNCYNLELGLSSSPYSMDVKQFFLNPEARRFFSNKIRYAQARWGYSPAIGVWQLTSEIDQYGAFGNSDASNNNTAGSRYAATSSNYDEDHVVATEEWNIYMAEFLSNLYPRHLITTNYISNPFTNNTDTRLGACTDKSYLISDKLDIIALNNYNYGGDEFYDRKNFQLTSDIVYDENNNHCNSENQGYFVDKPYFLTESGNSKNKCDACTDISMHNSSWAALCSGQMGIPLQWHAHGEWNEVDKTDIEDFYSNFDGLASFVNGLDFETHKYRPSVKNEDHLFHEGGVLWDENTSQNDALLFEVFSMQNDHTGSSESDRAFGWINHRQSRWDMYTSGTVQTNDPVTNKPITTCNSDNLYSQWDNIQKSNPKDYWLNDFKAGNYFLNVYNTRTGQLINSYLPGDPESPYADPITHTLLLKLPFENLTYSMPDIAFKIWHVSVNGNNMRTDKNSSKEKNSLNNKEYIRTNFLSKDSQTLEFTCKVTPNPGRSFFNITSSGNNISSISIQEASGKIVRQINGLNTNNFNIESGDLSPGLFFIRVVSTFGNQQTLKWIKL